MGYGYGKPKKKKGKKKRVKKYCHLANIHPNKRNLQG